MLPCHAMSRLGSTVSMRASRRVLIAAPLAPTSIFSKIPIPVDRILDRLWRNGLLIDDRASTQKTLESVGYFRMLIYMRHFQNSRGAFLPKTKFSKILELYEFDRKLKALVMDGIERIEVKLRAALSNQMGLKYGAHWYLSSDHFEDTLTHHTVMGKVIQAANKKKMTSSVALNHYY